MRRFISFLAIMAIILVSNCTRIPVNNDPVIGVWSKTDLNQVSSTQKVSVRQEWIFNDAYLGRYHRYEGSNLAFKTDYSWVHEDGMYIISYPGTDIPVARVSMKEGANGATLEDEKGNVLARRE